MASTDFRDFENHAFAEDQPDGFTEATLPKIPENVTTPEKTPVRKDDDDGYKESNEEEADDEKSGRLTAANLAKKEVGETS